MAGGDGEGTVEGGVRGKDGEGLSPDPSSFTHHTTSCFLLHSTFSLPLSRGRGPESAVGTKKQDAPRERGKSLES